MTFSENISIRFKTWKEKKKGDLEKTLIYTISTKAPPSSKERGIILNGPTSVAANTNGGACALHHVIDHDGALAMGSFSSQKPHLTRNRKIWRK